MRQNSIFVILIAGIMLGSGFGLTSSSSFLSSESQTNANSMPVTLFAPEVSAHVPVNVNATAGESGTEITIKWTHNLLDYCGGSGATICGKAQANAGEVDIIVINNTTGTKYYPVNNGTGAVVDGTYGGKYVVGSLAQGQLYSFTVCHGVTTTQLCAAGTNALPASMISLATHVAPIKVVFSNVGDHSVKLDWSASNNFNNTDVERWQIEYRLANDTSNINVSTPFTSVYINNSTGLMGGVSGSGNDTNTEAGCIQCGLTTSYLFEGLEKGKLYDFRVSGLTADGSAGVSEVTSGTSSIMSQQTAWSQQGKGNAAPVIQDFDATGMSGSVTNVKATLYEDKGADRILESTLYVNVSGDTTDDSDTSITWNYFDGTAIVDPNGFIRDVNVQAMETGVRTFDVDYQITYAKQPYNSGLILEATDFTKKSSTAIITGTSSSGANLEVELATPTLWAPGIIDQNVPQMLLADLEFFITEQALDVSNDSIMEVVPDQFLHEFTVTQNTMVLGHDEINTIVISGTVIEELFHSGIPVIFSITNADGFEITVNAVTTSDKTFGVPVIVSQFESGTYDIQANYVNLLGESVSFEILN